MSLLLAVHWVTNEGQVALGRAHHAGQTFEDKVNLRAVLERCPIPVLQSCLYRRTVGLGKIRRSQIYIHRRMGRPGPKAEASCRATRYARSWPAFRKDT